MAVSTQFSHGAALEPRRQESPVPRTRSAHSCRRVILKAARTVASVSVNAVLCKAAPSGEEHYGHVQSWLSFYLANEQALLENE